MQLIEQWRQSSENRFKSRNINKSNVWISAKFMCYWHKKIKSFQEDMNHINYSMLNIMIDREKTYIDIQ